jgi:hypothetical protein
LIRKWFFARSELDAPRICSQKVIFSGQGREGRCKRVRTKRTKRTKFQPAVILMQMLAPGESIRCQPILRLG